MIERRTLRRELRFPIMKRKSPFLSRSNGSGTAHAATAHPRPFANIDRENPRILSGYIPRFGKLGGSLAYVANEQREAALKSRKIR